MDPDPVGKGSDGRLLLHVFPTFAAGGAQMRFAAIANRFGPAYRHVVVSMDGEDACRARLAPDLDLTFQSVAARKGRGIANLVRFRRVLRELRPDVLVTSNWGSIEWAMVNAWPLARHLHTEDGFGPEELGGQLQRRVLARRIFLRRSMVVVPSRTLLRIATDIWRLDPRRLHYIPNGIDLSRFGATASAARWPGDGPVIGTVAGLRAEKNLGRLLRAFGAVVGEGAARLVIVGDGPDRASLERLARQLGLGGSVLFTGFVAEPQPLYASFDLFALASDTEQMPLSVLEAMAAGLPIAATAVGDVRSMVALENEPFIVPCDDAALSDGLRALLRDPALRRRVGAANRAKAEKSYDQETMFRAYARLLDGPGP
jgi:glycosyltransferase involved in cell wall biosynthesis